MEEERHKMKLYGVWLYSVPKDYALDEDVPFPTKEAKLITHIGTKGPADQGDFETFMEAAKNHIAEIKENGRKPLAALGKGEYQEVRELD